MMSREELLVLKVRISRSLEGLSLIDTALDFRDAEKRKNMARAVAQFAVDVSRPTGETR